MINYKVRKTMWRRAMNNSRSYIPGWLIFVGFMIGFWPGLILLIIRILQGASSDNAARRAQERRERDVRRTYQPPESSTVHTVDYRRAQESSPRVYQSPRGCRPTVRFPAAGKCSSAAARRSAAERSPALPDPPPAGTCFRPRRKRPVDCRLHHTGRWCFLRPDGADGRHG